MAVFPIHNILVVPDAYIYFKAEYYRQYAGKPPVQDEKVILIVAKEDLPRSELTNDSFYPIGLSGVITEVSDNGFVVIRPKNRVRKSQRPTPPPRHKRRRSEQTISMFL